MTLKFYFDLLSQPSRTLYIIFKLTNLPHESIPVALRNGVHLTEEFKKDVSRFQKVPCIIDNGFKLAESVAILRYLKNTTNCIPDQLYPSDLRSQAQVDEYLEWQHNNTRATCAHFFQLVWLRPKFFGAEVNPKQVAGAKKLMESCLDTIENTWLADKKFITGNTMTAADIFAACEIEQPRMAGYDPTIGRPKLAAWWGRVKKETNPYYDEAHAVVEKIVASSKM